MAVSDIYQVRLHQQAFGIDLYNVWYYRQTAGSTLVPLNATHLWSAFDAAVHAPLIAVQGDYVDHLDMDVTNIRLPSDYFQFVFSGVAGTRTPPVGGVDPAPTFLAWTHKSARPYPGTRSARKRFAGLFEGDIDTNDLSAAFIALGGLATLSTAMGATINNSGDTFQPVVIHRPIVLGSNPVVSYVPSTWTLDQKVSTQNSRKS